MEFLTTEQVAARLGVTPRRVQAMAKAGRLPASRFGRSLMMKESDLALVAERKRGRPPKAASTADQPAEAEPAQAEQATKTQAGKKAGTKKAAKKQG